MIFAVGMGLVCLCAFFLCQEYGKMRAERRAQYEEIYRYLKHIENKMKCSLSPIGDISREFLTENGSVREVVAQISRGVSADEKIGALLIGAEDKRLLQDFFSSFGQAYISDEKKKLEAMNEIFEKSVVNDRKECEVSVRVFAVLTTAFVSATFLLIA